MASFGISRQGLDVTDSIFCDFLETFDILKPTSDSVFSNSACVDNTVSSEDDKGKRKIVDTKYFPEGHELLSCNDETEQFELKHSPRPVEDSQPATGHVNVVVTSEPSELQIQWAEQCQTSVTERRDQPQTTEASRSKENVGRHTLEGITRVVIEPQSFWSLVPKTAWANPNVGFTNKERTVLEAFLLRLKSHNTAFYARYGRQFPVINLSLVSIEYSRWQQLSMLAQSRSVPNTHICISGFEKSEDIRAFDRLMSKTGYKHLYSPLKLCYEKRRIIRSAMSSLPDISPSFTRTLCGGLATFEDPNGSLRTSTIGGLIEVNGQTFALTTSHHPEDEMIVENQKDTPCLADLITAFADGEPEDGDFLQPGTPESLTMRPEHQEEGENLESTAIGPGSSCGSLLNQDSDEPWNDWNLVSVEPVCRLPNIVFDSNKEVQITAFGSLDAARFLDENPWHVSIISGMSGVVHGVLSSNPSYMLPGTGNSFESWSIRLSKGDLRAGDSGSWVIRESDCSLLGMVIARSAGSAYMISWGDIQSSIGKRRGLATDAIGLPIFPSNGEVSHAHNHEQSIQDITTDLPEQRYHSLQKIYLKNRGIRRLWERRIDNLLSGQGSDISPYIEMDLINSMRTRSEKHPAAKLQIREFKPKLLVNNADIRCSFGPVGHSVVSSIMDTVTRSKPGFSQLAMQLLSVLVAFDYLFMGHMMAVYSVYEDIETRWGLRSWWKNGPEGINEVVKYIAEDYFGFKRTRA
ncbi:hypothetical protein Landi51_06674 [Colletotrichum acutatum]